MVERHIIDRNYQMFEECDRLCFASKNIYNRALYLIKQDYESTGEYNVLNNLFAVIKNEECYQYLPCNVLQQTLRILQKNWKSYFGLLKAKAKGKLEDDVIVNPPKFLNKKYGRFVCVYTERVISKKVFNKAHKVKLSQCNIEVPTKIEKFDDIACARIIPEPDRYVLEIVYNVPDIEIDMDSEPVYASMDIGVNNLGAVYIHKAGCESFIINGRPLKSINQHFNKNLAHDRSILDKQNSKYKSSHRIKDLSNKRTDKINDYLHKASKIVVDRFKKAGVTIFVIGKNDYWKQGSNIGDANNQNFVMIPHSRFISMLQYKCERVGIQVVLTEERYTSLCSSIDNESVEKHEHYAGKRTSRGMFQSKDGTLINADINAAINILRKVVPNCLQQNGIEGLVVSPLNIAVKN